MGQATRSGGWFGAGWVQDLKPWWRMSPSVVWSRGVGLEALVVEDNGNQ